MTRRDATQAKRLIRLLFAKHRGERGLAFNSESEAATSNGPEAYVEATVFHKGGAWGSCGYAPTVHEARAKAWGFLVKYVSRKLRGLPCSENRAA